MLHERDESLPDVNFISSDEDADDGADVISVEHKPAAENRMSSQCEPERARTLPQAAQASASAIAVDHSNQNAAGRQQPYIFTHYRRCSADIAAALKTRDAGALLAILICVQSLSQSSPPPIPSHKVRDRVLQLTMPATLPPFLPVEVCPIARAIQGHWSSYKSASCGRSSSKDASASSAKSKKNAELSSKSKAKKAKKKKRKRKEVSSRESSCSPVPTRRHKGKNKKLKEKLRQPSTLRSGTAFKSGVEMITCALAGCLRTFTSESSMLQHLRDKHKVLDARLTAKQRKEDAPSNIQLDSIEKSCIHPIQPTRNAPPAPAPPPIACVAEDSVGARLLRLSGWTGGGLGPGGTGISGASYAPTFSFFFKGPLFHGFFSSPSAFTPALQSQLIPSWRSSAAVCCIYALPSYSLAVLRSNPRRHRSWVASRLGRDCRAGARPSYRAEPRYPTLNYCNIISRSPPPGFCAACFELTALGFA